MSSFIVGIFRGLLNLAAVLIVLACGIAGAVTLRAWLPGESPTLAGTLGGMFGLLAGLLIAAVLLGLQFLAVRINENVELVIAKLNEVNANLRVSHERSSQGPTESRIPSTGSSRVEPRL
jgi:hypothetical protein